jgi:hypothetical protein
MNLLIAKRLFSRLSIFYRVSFKSKGDKWENLFWIKPGGGPTLSTGLIKLSTIPRFSFLSRLKLLFALSEKEEHCNKETVLKVVNILHEKFQVGICTDFVLIVGDGKSYDHLIKLKSEYGSNLDWVLPYTGDWHILKNVLPVFV